MKTAISKIRVLGHGFELITVGRHTLVKSVPQELNTDKTRILEFAQKTGYVSKPLLIQEARWTEHRIDHTLQVSLALLSITLNALQGQELLKDGLAMVDDGGSDGIRLYWFPCVREMAI